MAIDKATIDKLKGLIPDSVLAQIPETAKAFGITNNLRLAHFLAQCAHESGGFKAVSENLNYSPLRLKQVFPKYFPGTLNEEYGFQPERIANLIYSNRMGNGSAETGDGFRFRGRGYIQLTGKSNYAAFDKLVSDDILNSPELVATKYPLASAAFFFMKRGIWPVCDKGPGLDTITEVTKLVNGGTIGIKDRVNRFNIIYNLIK